MPARLVFDYGERLMNRIPHICLLLLAIAVSRASAADDEFDVLFTNAKTRASLDEARHNFSVDVVPQASGKDDQQNVQRSVTLNGIVIKKGGGSQVWINNQTSLSPAMPVEAFRIKAVADAPKVDLTLSGGDKVELKPGEIYSLETGNVHEIYEQRAQTGPADLAIRERPEEQENKAEDGFEFDESKLAEQDSRIQLLEERLEQLETELTSKEK